MLRFSQWIARIGMVAATATLFTACGGGGSSSSSSSTTPTPVAPIGTNVALASAGGSVTSSFMGNESFVIDGDTTTNFWSAGAVFDTLTLDFGEVFALESVMMDTVGLTSNTVFALATSIDGVTFTEFDNVLTCSTFRLGASSYECEFTQTIDAQFLRLTILDNVENIEIYEIDVTGV